MGDDGPHRGRRLGHVLGREHDQHRVERALGRGDVNGRGVVAGLGRGRDVDGVVDEGGVRQGPAQLPGQFLAQRGHGQPGLFHRVRGNRARAAGVGDDQHPVALGGRLQGQGRGRVEQGVEGVGAADAGPLESRAVGRVFADEHAGVVGRGPGAGGGGAGLEDDHRLAAAGRLGRLDEPVAIADVLQVADDHPGVLVLGQGLEHVHLGDVRLVADGNGLGHAQFAFVGDVHHGRAQCAGLGEDGHAARLGDAPRERGVHADGGVDHAQAVGAEQAHPAALADGDQLVLQGPPLGTGLLEARGHDHHGPGLLGHRVTGRGRDHLRRHGDHHQVDRVRVVGQLFVNRQTEQFTARGIDRNNRSLEATLHQVAEREIADLANGLGGADNGDRPGGKQSVEHGNLVHDATYGTWMVNPAASSALWTERML